MKATKHRSSLVRNGSTLEPVGYGMYLYCYLASSGAVTINADSSVQILAEEAFPVDRLDAQVSLSGEEAVPKGTIDPRLL